MTMNIDGVHIPYELPNSDRDGRQEDDEENENAGGDVDDDAVVFDSAYRRWVL
jgi:hypothetical protein